MSESEKPFTPLTGITHRSAPEPASESKTPVILLPEPGHIPVFGEPLPVVSAQAFQVGPRREHAVSREALKMYVKKIASPHCSQVLAESTHRHLTPQDLVLRPAEKVPMFLTDASPAIPFVDRPDHERSPLHWGQMKLFLSEVWFLANRTGACAGTRVTVVYAGAAPGHHIPYLAGLFPTCTFRLYDPADFCPALAKNPPANVTVHQAFFTEEVAAQLGEELKGGEAQGTDFVFISDIRTGKEEDYVKVDMDRQESWISLLNPRVSLVKFRLPWQPGKTTYLDGQILLGVYHPLTSTESRLVVPRGSAPRVYDNTAYEQQCAYHNTVGRVFAYDHGVTAKGLDRCHDCTVLTAVVKDYLRRAGKEHDQVAVGKFIAVTCKAFGTGRTLATKYAPSSNRSKKQFPSRDYSGDELKVVREIRGGRQRRGGRGGRGYPPCRRQRSRRQKR
jgi:hypothetical protein